MLFVKRALYAARLSLAYDTSWDFRIRRNRSHTQFCVAEPINNAVDLAAINADVREDPVIQGFQSRDHFPPLPVLDGVLTPSQNDVHPP